MYTQIEIVDAFNEEMGDASGLFSTNEITRWFNSGAALLEHYKATKEEYTWTAGTAPLSIALTNDEVHIDRLEAPPSVDLRGEFLRHGDVLYLDIPDGDTYPAGSIWVYAWSRWPLVTNAVASEMALDADTACIYYALSRGYRKISANRTLYKRYSTLLGANAVTLEDCRRMSDELYEDYREAKLSLPLFRG